MIKTFLTLCVSLTSHFSIDQIVIDEQLTLNDRFQNEFEASQDNLETLNQLTLLHQDINLDSTIYFGEKYINMAIQLKANNRLLSHLGIVSQAYIYKGNLPKALELGLRAEQIKEDIPRSISKPGFAGIGPAHFSLSEIYFQIGDDEKLLLYANKQLNLVTMKWVSIWVIIGKQNILKRITS
jgi:tetratricopeptide (TPR) repeat protein